MRVVVCVCVCAKTNQKLQACHIKNNVIMLSQSTVIKINIKLH